MLIQLRFLRSYPVSLHKILKKVIAIAFQITRLQLYLLSITDALEFRFFASPSSASPFNFSLYSRVWCMGVLARHIRSCKMLRGDVTRLQLRNCVSKNYCRFWARMWTLNYVTAVGSDGVFRFFEAYAGGGAVRKWVMIERRVSYKYGILPWNSSISLYGSINVKVHMW